jgi:hypothetical protein
MATKELTALIPEMDCDQVTIGLPPVASAVFLMADFGKMWASQKTI